MKLLGTDKKLGFTLVELSIVLVVIGLLIGGILVGQSMIETANITAQIRQLQQMDIAIANFKNKYKYMPGDCPFLGVAGDGDRKLENTLSNGGAGSSAGSYTYEVSNFWKHLQYDNFLSKEYAPFSNDASAGVRADTHLPRAKIGKNKAAIMPLVVDVYPTRSPAYYLCGFENTPAGGTHYNANVQAVLTGAQALSMDQKIDDGIAGSTNLLTYYNSIAASSASPSCYSVSGTEWRYDVSNSNITCCLQIAIGINTNR